MDKSWKREEREVAKAFMTTRAIMKCTGEKSDIAHDTFCVEVKLRKRWGGKASGLKSRFIPTLFGNQETRFLRRLSS